MKPFTVKIRLSLDDEFRVPDPSGREGPAYYTDDRRDALSTAAIMWAEVATYRAVIFRVVRERAQ